MVHPGILLQAVIASLSPGATPLGLAFAAGCSGSILARLDGRANLEASIIPPSHGHAIFTKPLTKQINQSQWGGDLILFAEQSSHQGHRNQCPLDGMGFEAKIIKQKDYMWDAVVLFCFSHSLRANSAILLSASSASAIQPSGVGL
jgi:hypothetical protein